MHADCCLNAFLTPEQGLPRKSVREEDIEGIACRAGDQRKRDRDPAGGDQGGSPGDTGGHQEHQQTGRDNESADDDQAGAGAEEREQQKPGGQGSQDRAYDVDRVEEPDPPGHAIRRAGAAERPEVHADRKGRPEQQHGREDRDEARHEERCQVGRHHQLHPGPDLRREIHAPHEGPERAERGERGGDLQHGEHCHPVPPPRQQRSDEPAADGNAGEHRRQHCRKGVDRGPDEQHGAPEPDHLESQ